MTLKLFVWVGFSSDFTDGLAFAIAENETEARQMILTERGYEPSNWGDLEIHELNEKVAFSVVGGG